MRIKIGDIIINKWKDDNSIERKGIYVGSGWLQDLIEQDCNIEDEGRCKVIVTEIKQA